MYFAFLRLRFGWWIRIVCAVAAIGMILSVIGQAHGSISRVASVFALFPLLLLIAGVLPVLLGILGAAVIPRPAFCSFLSFCKASTSTPRWFCSSPR